VAEWQTHTPAAAPRQGAGEGPLSVRPLLAISGAVSELGKGMGWQWTGEDAKVIREPWGGVLWPWPLVDRSLVPGPMWTFGFSPLCWRSPWAAWALLAVLFGGLLVLAAVRARAGTRKAPDWLDCLGQVKAKRGQASATSKVRNMGWPTTGFFFLWTCGYGPLTTKDFNLDGADLCRARTRQEKEWVGSVAG
jgi:hypothetical protein